MLTSLIAASLLGGGQTRVRTPGLNDKNVVVTLVPESILDPSTFTAGKLPRGLYGRREYLVREYSVSERDALRTVTYVLQYDQANGDYFKVHVTFLSNNGYPPKGALAIKGEPVYVGDAAGNKQWVYVETEGGDNGKFSTRFNAKTPHFAPSVQAELISAAGCGKASVSLGTDNRYQVALTTYLFSNADRRTYYMLAGTLKMPIE